MIQLGETGAEDTQIQPVTPDDLIHGPAKMEWINPHIWFYIDVTDESGAVQHWQLDGGPGSKGPTQ